jgi:hypothetical protein
MEQQILILESILRLIPEAQFSVKENGDIIWRDDKHTQPTTKEIEDSKDIILSEYSATEYQRNRVYPSLEDQADMQYWDRINGTTTWMDAITKSKDEYPKP